MNCPSLLSLLLLYFCALSKFLNHFFTSVNNNEMELLMQLGVGDRYPMVKTRCDILR